MHDNYSLFKRLHQQVTHITATVPYYRDFGMTGGDPVEALSALPIVTKAIIKNAYGAFISDEFARIRPSLVRSLNAPSKSIDYEVREREGIVVGETTGSTGVRFRCPKSIPDRLRLGKGIWSQRVSVDPFLKPGSLYRFIHPSFPNRAGIEPWRSDLKHILALYNDLSKSGYRWLHAASPMLLHHIDMLEREGIKVTLPHLRFIECSGDFLSNEAKSKIGKYFGVEVIDQYGTMETWTISLTCRYGVHHVNDHNVWVEILDDQDTPLPDEVIGRIVVTSLQTRLLPLVRYATADYGMFVGGTCPCGLGGKTLRLIEGRDFEMISGCPAPQSGTRLFRRLIPEVLLEIGHCNLTHIQIVQTSANEFLVKTNDITNCDAFREHLQKVVSASLSRSIHIKHVFATPAEIRAELGRKPCLFRRDTALIA